MQFAEAKSLESPREGAWFVAHEATAPTKLGLQE